MEKLIRKLSGGKATLVLGIVIAVIGAGFLVASYTLVIDNSEMPVLLSPPTYPYKWLLAPGSALLLAGIIIAIASVLAPHHFLNPETPEKARAHRDLP